MSASFFSVLPANHDACRRDSIAYLGTDKELSTVVSGLDAPLTALDRVASCADQCDGGDHMLEWLLTRCVSTVAAVSRLAEIGHYDEALILVRSLGELANLLALLGRNPTDFGRWKSLDDKTRRKEFQPSKVRTSLEQQHATVWMDEDRYNELCGKVHAVPQHRPQVFAPGHPPIAGACFQPDGLRECVFELAVQVSGILIAAASLKQSVRHLNELGESLLRSVPGVSVSPESPAP